MIFTRILLHDKNQILSTLSTPTAIKYYCPRLRDNNAQSDMLDYSPPLPKVTTANVFGGKTIMWLTDSIPHHRWQSSFTTSTSWLTRLKIYG